MTLTDEELCAFAMLCAAATCQAIETQRGRGVARKKHDDPTDALLLMHVSVPGLITGWKLNLNDTQTHAIRMWRAADQVMRASSPGYAERMQEMVQTMASLSGQLSPSPEQH